MTPSSTAHQRLHSALLTAFPTRSSLAALVHYGLGHNLEAIAGGTTLNDWVFTLIDWVAAHGQIPALLGAALGARPTDATFQTLVAELGAVHPPSGTASQLALLTSPDLPSRAIPVIPQQLRPAVPDFKGRAPEIDQLVAALRNATSDKSINCGIWGMTGVGKTELAYAAANRVLDRFPDGQILLQLRGTNPNPMTIEKAWNQVITRFVDDTTIPSDSGEIEALYHSVLATRRVLILADNAQDIHQVRALVPPGGNALIITGQTQFLLPGMVIVRLGMLTPEEATALVLDICPRIDLLASRIAQLCGYLPLALRAVASLLLVDAHRSIAHYVQLLEETHVSLARMRVPGDPNLDVEAALNLSYNALTKSDQEVLKKLSVFSASFNLVAASTLLDPATDIEPWPQGLLGSLRSATWSVETEDQVSPLLQRNLLQWDAATQRYSMHDLIRNFVRDQMTELEAIQVARRYARHYAIVATLAMQFHAGDIGDDRETPMASMYQVLGGRVVAGLVLLNEERPHIDAGWVWASIHAGTPEVDQLLVLYAAALSQVGAVRYDVQTEMLTKLQQGVAAARRLRNYPDLVEYARMEKSLVASLGAVYAEIGTTLRAAQLYKEALDLAVADEDHRMVGMLAGSLGEIAEVASDYGQAAKLFNQSLLLLRRVGDRAREAIALYNLGNLCIRLNKLDASLGYYKKALDISEEVDDPRQKAATLSGLGRCYLLQNEVDKSISYLQEAFNLLYSIGDWPAAAKVLANLGVSAQKRGVRPELI